MSARPSWLRSLAVALGLALAALAALSPWWRNHGYLRDFYDYGLVMSGAGRIAAGERPYRDFVTPIQTGTFLFNSWAECAGDGDYQAMTRGAAVLIVFSVIGVTVMFARRWPAGIAIGLAAALVAMSASQHTIIWHNALGALCLVAAAWSAALAPVWRRASWPWLLVAALALFVGGINKLNAQLVALAAVFMWTLRAWTRGEARTGRVLATFAGWTAAGVLAPLGFELAWTGATLRAWWHNVIALPFSSRAGDFGWVLRPEFYLSTRHDYYGDVSLPWLGALGLGATVGVGVVLWRGAASVCERVWVVVATFLVAGAGAGLMATNYEIAWVAMASWLGLLAVLWVGFGQPPRGKAFFALVVAPTMIVGATAGESAWRGQRSQFGYSVAPRASYVDAGTVHAEFSYLRGTRVPPEIAQTMDEAMRERWKIPPPSRAEVFYGPGLEWLERVWPTTKVRELPLWMHLGTSYGPKEAEKLREVIQAGGAYRYIVVTQARNHWSAGIDAEIRRNFARSDFGPTWVLYRALPVAAVPVEPLAFLSEFGGNVDPARLRATLEPLALADGRKFLGTTQGVGTLALTAPSYRVELEAVIRRIDLTLTGPVRLRFESFGLSDQKLLERGSFDAELPANETERLFARTIDPGGMPMVFAVTLPADLAGRVEAGWRGLRLTHAIDDIESPPSLSGAAPAARMGDDYVAALVPEGATLPVVFARLAGAATADGVVLAPGGEVWLRVQGGMACDFAVQIIGELRPPALPVLRLLYYKGGRIEILRQDAIRTTDPVTFHAWSAEAGGWIGLILDRSDSVPALRVKAVRLAQ